MYRQAFRSSSFLFASYQKSGEIPQKSIMRRTQFEGIQGSIAQRIDQGRKAENEEQLNKVLLKRL